MTEQTVKEIIKSFAYGLSAKEISDNEGTSLEAMEMISHHRMTNSGFATLLSVKDLEFQLESICTATLLATDRRNQSLSIFSD